MESLRTLIVFQKSHCANCGDSKIAPRGGLCEDCFEDDKKGMTVCYALHSNRKEWSCGCKKTDVWWLCDAHYDGKSGPYVNKHKFK